MSTQRDRQRDRDSRQAGDRQRERERGGGGNQPWGFAKVPIQYGQGDDAKTVFVPIGVVWETENGNLRLNIDAEPPQWSDPHFRRSVIILKNDREGGQ